MLIIRQLWENVGNFEFQHSGISLAEAEGVLRQNPQEDLWISSPIFLRAKRNWTPL
jgi:hypothetical protein